MANIKLTQVWTYANWPSESFEIWRFYPANKSHKEISKEMRSLFIWIFSNIANKDPEELENACFTVGGNDVGMEVKSSKVKEIIKKIYYGWYHGNCLDKDRLQYFKPIRIIKQGIVYLIEENQVEFYEILKSNIKNKRIKLSPKLVLRRMLGDDPKRIEVDEMRLILGLQSDILFDWKEEFQIKTKKHSKK